MSSCPTEHPVLIPLSFETQTKQRDSECINENTFEYIMYPCILCEHKFDSSEYKSLSNHLSSAHSVQIEDLENIPLLSEYLNYWKREFIIRDFKNVLTFQPQFGWHVLGADVEEDRKVRFKLLNKKIQVMFDSQIVEWSSGRFVKKCFFCAHVVFTNQTAFFNHLNEFHHFMLGSPHNFVNLSGFLNVIEEKLKKLQCLYCERFFKDYPAFKEHIRKKHHKRIRATNQAYHQFFFDKHPELDKLKKLDGVGNIEDDDDDDEEEDDEYLNGDDDDGADLISVPMEQRLLNSKIKKECCDWTEEASVETTCLYCSFSSLQYSCVLEHMKDKHRFDLEKAQGNANFYQSVKLINYLRRQIYHNTCPICVETFSTNQQLQRHFELTNHHSEVPPMHLFDQFQYYFPTYEEDPMLSFILQETPSPRDVTPENYALPVLDESYLESLSLKDN